MSITFNSAGNFSAGDLSCIYEFGPSTSWLSCTKDHSGTKGKISLLFKNTIIVGEIPFNLNEHPGSIVSDQEAFRLSEVLIKSLDSGGLDPKSCLEFLNELETHQIERCRGYHEIVSPRRSYGFFAVADSRLNRIRAKAFFLRGKESVKEEKWSEARDYFKVAADLKNEEAEAKFLLIGGVSALNSSAWDMAKFYFEKAAQLGESEAQCRLGIIYLKALGVSKDVKQAHQLFEKSAEKNHPEALYFLACRFLEGDSVPQDSQKAKELFQQSLKYGYAPAKVMLELL